MERSNRITNGFLKPIQDRIEIIEGDPYDRLRQWAKENTVPLSQGTAASFGTAIDWNSLSHFETAFDYEGSEAEIRALLSASDLSNCGRVVILTAQDDPVLLVATEVFIENYDSFWAASGYMQLLVFSQDGRYVMEFEDNSFLLYSNFKIA